MKQNDEKLSKYIDQLNAERRPMEHTRDTGSEEFNQLADTVRRVRILKKPPMPEDEFEKKLIASLHYKSGGKSMKQETHVTSNIQQKKSTKRVRHSFILIAVAAAAAVLLFAIPNIKLPGDNTGIVYAMEQAYSEVKAYHGIIEVVVTNELGEQMLQSKREVWADQEGNYYLKELEGFTKGLVTVNNTQKEWQIRPEEESIYLFLAFPDPYRFTFELGSEVEDAKKALTVKEIGEEQISGRNAMLLEVTPEGGEAYRLWIDKETELPLQRQSAMENAIQYKITYTGIEFVDAIPKELITYQVPEGYDVKETNSEQIVTTLEEAEELVGFAPMVIKNLPEDYKLKAMAVLTNTNTLKLYYGTSDSKQIAVILQSKATAELKAEANAVIGSVNNNTAEILTNYEGVSGITSIRWQENGMEYTVFGDVSLETLSILTKGLTQGAVEIPKGDEEIADQPQIEVPVDLAVEESDQKSVDAGHSPWKLDPVFVAQVFASLLITPEGITGDYPIPYDNITIIGNNGTEAIAEINSDNTVAKYVYLKRLIRQDDTGIWTVVGYDPVSE
jgi:outer membrane lipoprotein-sorting protein